MKYTHFNRRPYEIHTMAYELVTAGSSVLDLGCASGYFVKKLMMKNCNVTGVDVDAAAIHKAKKYCEKVITADLDSIERNLIPKQKYDYIVILDVIEHLKHFNELLILLKTRLSKNGKIIISTPNIAHLSIRMQILTGNFDYSDYGILDRDHVHFFTLKTLKTALISAGYTIHSIDASSDFGQIPLFGRFFRNIPKMIQWHITKIFPTVFGVQWLAVGSRRIDH